MSPPTSAACEQLYATMLLSDSYLPGALVLGHSLRDAGTKRKMAVLVTLDTLSASSISQLKAVYDYILPVPRIRNEHPANLSLMNRSDLHSAFTKINLWKQTQFSKIVYMDADVIAYRAPDELFDLPHGFSAAPDVGWPDIFNTGVMVLTPNMGDYYAMLAMAERGISFDGADQGLINMYFKNSANRLPFTYNVTPSAHYQYIPAYLHFQSSISMVHFIGANKPWFSPRNSAHSNNPVDQMLGRWWAVHDRHYRTQKGHDHHEPHAVYVNAAFDPITGALKSPFVHTVNDQVEKNDMSERLSRGQADPRPRPDSTSTTAYTTRDSENPMPEQFVEHETLQLKPPHSPPPMNSWDAQRQPPPPNSKPEAIDFPTAHYEMSRDTSPFVPPMRYPSPPRNMWYEVPKQPPTSVGEYRQVFPWEAKQPTPSRSFAGLVEQGSNSVSSTAEASASSESLVQGLAHTGSSSHSGLPIPGSETRALGEKNSESTPATTGDPWNSFSRANAWDDIPGIGRYIEGFQKHRRNSSRSNIKIPESVTSPSATAGTLRMPRALRVTDFPTEVERPSLPVTPAPIKRPSFWSEDKNHSGSGDEARSLPMAEGVPSQPDWVCVHERRWKPADCPCNLTDVLPPNKNPAAQLQKLAQQQSEALLRRLGEDRPLNLDVPSRTLPFGSETPQFPSYGAQEPPQPPSPSSSLSSPQPVPGKPVTSGLVEDWAGAYIPSPEMHNKADRIGTAKH
ncbi:hypothetical protein E4U55_000700 [Claviceps digitariae]|nr:hypothetical protein E4U55_000700 [Claviceps digitariae]